MSYANSDSIIYTDNGSSSGIHWSGQDGYYYPQLCQLSVDTGETWSPLLSSELEQNRKENDMIQRQTFLDALADEGKSIGSEGREIIKEAEADKWELFIARLLARAFDDVDLAMLKEKPKEVLVKEA